jgi:hypothetical protein
MSINKNLLNNNSTFYPTPDKLISKMMSKIKRKTEDIKFILEPSAGDGAIINSLLRSRFDSYTTIISAIEKDDYLRSELNRLNTYKSHSIYKVIDSDFLTYHGYDKFDLIIMNPPFDEGEYHLQKAIDISFDTEIICLLNAQTLRNPYSNHRKALVDQLNKLNAGIEYISDAFLGCEVDRKTNVEIAIVHINIHNTYESLLNDCKDQALPKKENIPIEHETNEIITNDHIEALVQDYHNVINIGLDTIKNYFKNYGRIARYMKLNILQFDGAKLYDSLDHGNFNRQINEDINNFLIQVRKNYWHKVLDLPDVKKRMTEDRRNQFYKDIQEQSYMELTVNNIQSFILSLIGSYEDILTEAVTKLFDKLTIKYHWHEESDSNRHYYSGWKTNEAFYVNDRVIFPMYGGCGHPFISWDNTWKVDYSIEAELNDIDIVMNYFSCPFSYISIVDALKQAFLISKTRKIRSTFFEISVFKKRTIHLRFLNEDIRRRFNIVACKAKNWLPQDFGKKKYSDMSNEEKVVVDSFEGEEQYTKKLNQIGFYKNETIYKQLEDMTK